MNARRGLGVAAALAVLIPLGVDGQSWPPPVPTGGDSRVFISEILEDRVGVGVPYGYGENNWQEREFIDKWAQWSCSLYQRKAVIVSISTSDIACDQMGRAAAMRDPNCLHFYFYACGIPPSPER